MIIGIWLAKALAKGWIANGLRWKGIVAGKGTTYVIRPRRTPAPARPVARPKAGSSGPKQDKPKVAKPQRKSIRRSSIPILQAPPETKPKRSHGRKIAAGVLAVVAAAGFWSWRASVARFERARDLATTYFATRVQQPDPDWFGLFGYAHRRFGLVATLASGQAAHEASGQFGFPAGLDVYRRIEDPMAFVDERRIEDLPTQTDRILAGALHCDRIGLPDDWIEVLRKSSMLGGYALTRSILATEWTVENGCLSSDDVAALRADQIARLVTFVDRRHELGDQFDTITDLWIEAVAMLHYIGAGSMVRDEWLEELLEIQNEDGGWSRTPFERRSDPHTSALALWILLEHLEPDSRPTTWIRQLG